MRRALPLPRSWTAHLPPLADSALAATKLAAIKLAAIMLATAVPATNAFAGALTLHIGPPSLGGGGPNPLSIPPTLQEFEAVWVTDQKREISIGLIPGLLYGYRTAFKSGTYVSAGGGIIINPDKIGPGVYAAFGYTVPCKYLCFNIEYKQSIGITSGAIYSPYAVRMGGTWEF